MCYYSTPICVFSYGLAMYTENARASILMQLL